VKYVEWDCPEAQAKGELNFLHYSNSKRFYSEPDVVEYGKTLIAKSSIHNLMWLSTTDSENKRFYSEPDAVEYKKNSKPQHDLIFGTKP
jgi:hypothetical protein